MQKSGSRIRAVAAETVDAVVTDGRSLDHAIQHFESRLPPADRALMRLLSYGAVRHHYLLQDWIAQLLTKPFRKRDSVVRALLAVGLYQLQDTRVPEHAAVSLTVDAVRQLRRPQLAGVVNACLRRFLRDAIADQPAASDQARWNHPDWLIAQLRKDWPDDWSAILDANMQRAPMWLRVDRSRQSAAGYARAVDGTTIPGLRDAVRLPAPLDVEALPGFEAGEVSVQDGAAQLAADWLMTAVGGRVLDACAAPGGKTGHLLELGAEVVAVDRDPERNQRIESNLARLGRSATILSADASNPKAWWDGVPFDAILLDAPCSATGVIRRHPDIKLTRRKADIAELARLQAALLDALWPLLKPGGRLMYVTCSVLAAENDAIVTAFLEKRTDAIEDDVLPNYNIRDVMRRKVRGYQILPGTADLDGFYFACLNKKVS